jgi:hypothetical protein
MLLLGIRVEQQGVGLRGTPVGALRLDRGIALLDGPLGGGVAGERVENGMLEITR